MNNPPVLKILGIITLLQLWWVSVWGICYIAIERIAGKCKYTEIYLYLGTMIFVYVFLNMNPDLLKHLV
jgi:hypothetical protein